MATIDGKKSARFLVMRPSHTRVSEGTVIDPPGSISGFCRNENGAGRKTEPRLTASVDSVDLSYIVSRKEY